MLEGESGSKRGDIVRVLDAIVSEQEGYFPANLLFYRRRCCSLIKGEFFSVRL